MRNLLLALLHLAVMAAKLCGHGGVRAVMAENLLLKQQLIVLRRARQRAPNLTLERPAAVRILVAVPQSGTHPKGRDRVLCENSAGTGSLTIPPYSDGRRMPARDSTERKGRSVDDWSSIRI